MCGVLGRLIWERTAGLQEGRNGPVSGALCLPLDADHDSARIWARVAERALAWLAAQGVSPRDAVVLLPFAQHLAPARRAFGATGQWLPQIATTHSLAAALGPNTLAGPGEISFDPAIDALAAARLLETQSWAAALRERDARAWRLGVARLVELAHALLRAAQQRAPGAREAFWQAAREVFSGAGASGSAGFGQPGGTERALALVAVEWAAADAREPPTDALFALRPGAWIVVEAGGADPLVAALLGASIAPRLKLATDIDFADARAVGRVELADCPDFEALAQASAASVLDHLAAGRAPLALIAQDRVLLRRVRALLERQGVGLHDETGWTLATSAPAAQLMALLRAAQPHAGLDAWLAWLKSDAAAQLRERAARVEARATPAGGHDTPEPPDLAGGQDPLDALELACRRFSWRTPRQVHAERLPAGARALWFAARDALLPLRDGAAPRSLLAWIAALRASASINALQQLPAGREVLEALWLTRQPWDGSAHHRVLAETALRLKDFTAWVGETLEAQAWTPPPIGAVQVHVTPLARAMLRPFGAVVLPGVDAQTLPLTGRLPELLSDAQATALGLPDQAAQRGALARTFTQLLRAPHLTLLRRTAAGAEPLAPSPLLERLERALGALPAWQDPRAARAVAPEPQARAAAGVAGLLPASLSASQIEALRNCPYQFFGRVVLGLQEADELEAAADKRDYGIWLHNVLLRFHRTRRDEPGEPGGDAALLARCAEAERAPAGEDFLPYAASFARFAPRYLDWLAAAEQGGQRFADGELDAEIRPFADAVAGVAIRGRIDRVDSGDANVEVLIDYKTGSLADLKRRVATPLEDTQLAVYAALRPAATRAGYLALDDKDGIAFVEHPEVRRSAARVLDGLGADLAALHGGAPLPALGEGAACDYCAVRGLCRKDDWQ